MYKERTYPRHTEFNYRSELDNKGFEWRSFNLMGVKTWEEFKILMGIGFECINFLFKKRRDGYSSNNRTSLRSQGIARHI